ncbi:hypothetical protein ACGF3G_49875 [Streptomyces sp. NPDC048179]|uniref:hypothetical protein n=1 Tax=Streptomyces sp. NPDC048179 TaxID=3365506 RepID=UPI00371C83D4
MHITSDAAAFLGDGLGQGLLPLVPLPLGALLQFGDVGAAGGGVPPDQPGQQGIAQGAEQDSPVPEVLAAEQLPPDDPGRQAEQGRHGGPPVQPGARPVRGDQHARVVELGQWTVTGQQDAAADRDDRLGDGHGSRQPRRGGQSGVDHDDGREDHPVPRRQRVGLVGEEEAEAVHDQSGRRDQERLPGQ